MIIRRFPMVLIILICMAMLVACSKEKPTFSTEYQAVFMNNGQVFFGKIENAGGAYPLLKEVFYIGRQASPDGKEVKSILVKRGSELHGPDYMYINKEHIALIEPVSPTSQVGRLINEAKNQKPAETK